MTREVLEHCRYILGGTATQLKELPQIMKGVLRVKWYQTSSHAVKKSCGERTASTGSIIVALF